MTPPMVGFVVWNRLGLTARNLTALLNTGEDFELHIIDSNSGDNTWDFVRELKDERIKIQGTVRQKQRTYLRLQLCPVKKGSRNSFSSSWTATSIFTRKTG